MCNVVKHKKEGEKKATVPHEVNFDEIATEGEHLLEGMSPVGMNKHKKER